MTDDPARRARVAAASALAAGVVAALFASAIPVPLVYFPLEHRWALGTASSSGVAMDYFGRVAIVLVMTALGALVGRFLAHKLGASAVSLLLAWAGLAALLTLGFSWGQVYGRPLVPLDPSALHVNP